MTRASRDVQGDLFGSAHLTTLPTPAGWAPDAPPELRGEKHIVLNAETTGVKWWGGDKPIGWSYWLPESGRHGYLPVRHDAGGNLAVEVVREWMSRELVGVHVNNANTKFDLHMARKDGVDLREQGCTFGDVQFQAALLDDARRRFNLDQLSKDILGWDVSDDKIPSVIKHEGEFRYLHPSRVAPYAVRNVDQVRRLHAAFAPMIAAEQLEDVLHLEEEVLPAVVEMEGNGTFVDLPLLHEWRAKAQTDLEARLWDIRKQTGIMMTSPDSAREVARVFERLGLPITARTPTGQPSFTDATLRVIDHPCITALREARHLGDLKSNYLDKYTAAADADGWLRFNLHQCRNTKAGHDDVKGTVSGRFSAAGDDHGGYNPQQVVAVEKQLERGWCPAYVIRRLIIPDRRTNAAAAMAAADAKQIEYRLFAHYAEAPEVLAAYAANPDTDYHQVVMMLLHRANPNLNRKLTKNINFAKIYGAGLLKFALMLGLITEEEFVATIRRFGRASRAQLLLEADCREGLRAADAINQVYDKLFPQVKPLLRKASELAEQRGYVKTLLGRRARLTDRFHSALNRVIQGGAADIMKRKIVEVYKQRHALGLKMRLTVHDELMGDLVDASGLPALMRLLNAQSFNLKVPILWDGRTGANWAECK